MILPAAFSGTEAAPCWHIAPKETTAASIGCRSHSVAYKRVRKIGHYRTLEHQMVTQLPC